VLDCSPRDGWLDRYTRHVDVHIDTPELLQLTPAHEPHEQTHPSAVQKHTRPPSSRAAVDEDAEETVGMRATPARGVLARLRG
jgi:hypothetical protein